MAKQPIIPSPARTRDDPQRFADCQVAIKDGMLDLLSDAVEAGWTKDEVLAAMIALADDIALAMNAKVLLSIEAELMKLMKKKQ